jgi:hypothetical protein
MEDIRSEIRLAFEKEQASYPPVTAMRHEVVQAVAAEQRQGSSQRLQRRPNLQWLAAAASILLTVAIVAGLLAVKFEHAARAPGHQAPITNTIAPAAIPGTDYGPPPPGVPLLYEWDLSRPGALLGFDWSGRPRATLQLGAGLTWPTAGIQMSPDGQFFHLYSYGPAQPILDRLGHPTADALIFGIWADDNRHVCALSPGQLLIQGPNAPTRQVTARLALKSATASIKLAACSIKNDRAIAVGYSGALVSDLWSIRLSDGHVMSQRTYASSYLASIVASRDATLVAENIPFATHVPRLTAPTSTVVRRVSDWQVLFTLPGSSVARGFSDDDSRVLAVWPLTAGGQILTEIIDRTSGLVVWHSQSNQELRSFETNSGTGDFALAMGEQIIVACPPTAATPCSLFDDVGVVLVRSDGSTIQIPGRQYPVW